MKLYEISNEYQAILNTVNEDGEITDESVKFLDELQDDFELKAISVASYIKNIEAEEKAISDAIEQMKKRKESLARKVVSLTDYLQYNLQTLSITEIKSSPFFKIRLKQCPISVDVFDESLVPQEYRREKVTVTTSIDKIKLKEVLSEGVEVPGVAIQRKIKLEIK